MNFLHCGTNIFLFVGKTTLFYRCVLKQPSKVKHYCLKQDQGLKAAAAHLGK